MKYRVRRPSSTIGRTDAEHYFYEQFLATFDFLADQNPFEIQS